MADLDEVASRVCQGLVEMAETLRDVEQPGLAQLAEQMAKKLHEAIYEAMAETKVGVAIEGSLGSDSSTLEELEAVADQMRRLRKSMKEE